MLTIIQACDGCRETRQLMSTGQEEQGGWRLVTGIKHLCPSCIRKAVGE
jgi:hypothetical protein